MLSSFDHAVIAVRDLDTATDQYSGLLGLAPSWRGVHPEAGTANSLFRLANAYLELLAPTSTEAMGGAITAALARDGEGLLAICFGADDVEAFAAAMRSRDIRVADPIAGEGRAAESDVIRSWRTVMLPAQSTRGLTLFAIEHDSPDANLPLAEPTASAAAAVRALDHVVVSSGDIEASRALYGEVLGLRLALDRRFEARGLRMLFFRIGGVTVEVVGALDAAADSTDPDRFGGLAYQVEDAVAAHRRLVEAGLDVTDLRPGHKPGTRVCTVRGGTCGVPTLIIEPATGPRG